MPLPHYIVKASFDNDADVWHVEDLNVPDLSTEEATFEALCRKIEVMFPELLEANGVESGRAEIIAHTTVNLDRSAA